ncbi:TetR family transcriptional regulator [Planomonospora parontospora subsp. parontospora]|uniref:TetR family transcriptional regulator n=2 Tax=Planomonospora parontospora TaxID=58119 RepID=A0AA37F3K2_9ACTN|nr:MULTISPECIES: TetR family transcriptional regulator [Planomonospora]GGK59846.1 TetR family transcriptional regulator [Planomonospora parontospora]GII08846.1 TetR family transcriptional regulator [Planomonospora parontospora subsp. parontospora]
MAEPTRRTRGSDRTREAIVETALRLFRERGYEATTMRAIAAEAGVSVGNAYYYFSSKEALVQAYYDRAQAEHEAACERVLATERSLAGRLDGVLREWVRVSEPYHEFAVKFFKHAAEPSNPLSPFSADSSPAREASIAIYRRVVEGSADRMDAEIRAELPELLWLLSMGVVLFWVHDDSEGCRRTHRFIDLTVPLVDRLVGLSYLPGLRGVAKDFIAGVHELRS